MHFNLRMAPQRTVLQMHSGHAPGKATELMSALICSIAAIALSAISHAVDAGFSTCGL
jgi:hypothetical protein